MLFCAICYLFVFYLEFSDISSTLLSTVPEMVSDRLNPLLELLASIFLSSLDNKKPVSFSQCMPFTRYP